MKHFFIFSLILLCSSVFSQEPEQDYTVYPFVRIDLKNSDGETIKNAQVSFGGISIPYDSSRQAYYIENKIIILSSPLNIFSEGYDTIHYTTDHDQIIQVFGDPSYGFSATFYLKRPSEKFYYTSLGQKIPYQPHPNQLLVILDSKGLPIDDSLRFQFEREIQQKGLKINPNFPESPSDFAEELAFMSIPELEYRVVVEKEDGSDFESDYCEELAFLRSLDEVAGAGPLIILSYINKYHVVTYDHKISLYQFGASRLPEKVKKRSQEINLLVKQVDERYYYDEKTRVIVLPPDTNEILPEIMDKLKETGITEQMSTMLFDVSYDD